MHIDESNMLSKTAMTRITILIYLSNCQGGGTRFQVPNKNQNKDIVFAPQVGHMLLHLHGDDCLPHQGDVVEGGIKYVLRTDLVYSIE